MTPQELLYRDLFLAECWKPCPEYRQSKDERLDAEVRNAILAEQRGEPELPFRGAA